MRTPGPNDMMRAVPDYSFSGALDRLKRGQRIARGGWNGKGMWLILIGAEPGDQIDYIIRDDAYDSDVEKLTKLPWVGMRTANAELVPWLASQTDLLAEDWVIFEDDEQAEADD